MRVPIWVVDAFAIEPFSGNPAGVCMLRGPADVAWMQSIAKEMRHAETAFLHRKGDGWWLRWFSPAMEVDLCGHATLAAAHVLWAERYVPQRATLRFYTRSGLLTAVRSRGAVELDFPQTPVQPVRAPGVLRRALGAAGKFVGKNRFDYLVELESATAVQALRPDLDLLATLPVRGVLVTARSRTPGVDFVCRFFAPRAGVPEDPVTGSAFSTLGPYWSERLGRTDLVGRQLSERGGSARVRLRGTRVGIVGRAVTVLKGELRG